MSRSCLVAAVLLKAGAGASPEADDESPPVLFEPAAPDTSAALAALNTRHRSRLLARLALDRERAASR